MDKKQKRNQLNSQKGLTAMDALIALLIIITSLVVIAMVYTNLVTGSREVDRQTGASRIATNILENMQICFYDKIEQELETFSRIKEQQSKIYTVSGSQEGTSVFNTKIPAGYTAKITLENQEYDLVKKVTVEVTYHLNDQEENVSLSQVIEREQIRECNSPKFSEEYIAQLTKQTSYQMSYEQGGKDTIICPIQYNGQNYEILTEEEKVSGIWYSYANKQWARVLVLSKREYEECRSNSAQISKYLGDETKSYVWIPRFGVKESENLFGNTYFKYKNTNFAISNSQNDTTKNLVLNYLDFDESDWLGSNGISFNINDKVGKWSSCSKINDSNEDAYKLNQSQYGPLIEY